MFYQILEGDNVHITAASLVTALGSEGDWIIYENYGDSFSYFFY